jgi:peptidoglycan/LPS O-acetylase OafA/YrhL
MSTSTNQVAEGATEATLPRSKPKERLGGIESLRAYAAIAIVCFHVIWIPKIIEPNFLSFMKWYFGFGVPLFYVVSAFSLSYGYAGRLSAEQEILTFWIRRLARIAPLFYFMLVFQIINLKVNYNIPFSISDTLLSATFVFNFVPNRLDGIVLSSWTIGVEMIFYVLFPAILIICRNWLTTTFVFLLSILVTFKLMIGNVDSSINHTLVYNMPYFIAGILGFHLYQYLRERQQPGISGLLCITVGAMVLLILTQSPLLSILEPRGFRYIYDILWGLHFAAICCGMALTHFPALCNPQSRFLGKISFSLYLAHPNLVIALSSLGLYRWIVGHLPNPDLALILSIIVTLTLLIPIATLLFRYIEKPGMELGKTFLARAFHQESRP